MKRTIVLLLCILAISSCKKKNGTLKGVVTYHINGKADVGATVYAVSIDLFPQKDFDKLKYQMLSALYRNMCLRDDINLYRDSLRLNDLELDKKNGNISLQQYADEKKAIFESIDLDSSYKAEPKAWLIKNSVYKPEDYRLADSLARLAAVSLQDDKETLKTSVDGNGNFVISLPPGKFYVMIQSSNTSGTDLLDINGKLHLEIQDIVSEKENVLVCKFL